MQISHRLGLNLRPLPPNTARYRRHEERNAGGSVEHKIASKAVRPSENKNNFI